MSYSLKILDAAFTKYVSKQVPYGVQAKGLYLFGTDQASSIKNHANPLVPASIVGVPTYGSGFATFSSEANGIDAGFTGNSPFTHVLVSKVSSAASVIYCGNWTPGNPRNAITKSSTDLRVSVDGSPRAVISGRASSGFIFMAGSHDGSTAKVYQRTGSTLDSVSAAYSGGSTGANFRVGANGTYTGSFDAAAAITFNSVLSASQLGEVYDYLKELLASRGITVV